MPSVQKRALTLVGAAVVLYLGLFAAQAGLSDAVTSTGEITEVTNETWTPVNGTYVALANSNRSNTYYDEQVTVRDENDSIMSEPADYEWNHSFEAGTIKAVQGGDLDGDANATISYTYAEPDEVQSLIQTIVLIPFQRGEAIMFLLGIGFVLGALVMLRRSV